MKLTPIIDRSSTEQLLRTFLWEQHPIYSAFSKVANVKVAILQKIDSFAGVYSEPSQTSKVKVIVKVANSFNSLTILAKNFILEV